MYILYIIYNLTRLSNLDFSSTLFQDIQTISQNRTKNYNSYGLLKFDEVSCAVEKFG